MKTETPVNPYAGIEFCPDAAIERKFTVIILDGLHKRTIGHFPSLEEAIAARDRYLTTGDLAYKRTRQTATFPKHYETRLNA